LGVLCLIPVILKAKSDYVRFHARQGIILFIAEIIFILIGIIPFFGWIIGFLGWIVCLILSIYGLTKAFKGKEWQIPFLNKLVDKIRF